MRVSQGGEGRERFATPSLDSGVPVVEFAVADAAVIIVMLDD